MNPDAATIRISKLDAAKRQLDCAVELWFSGGDPVAIHTLAFASHEIIHVLNKKTGTGSPLLLDSPYARPEYREEIIRAIKEHGNFFKHADRDPYRVIEFNPTTSDGFLIFSILGLHSLGERLSNTQTAFNWWYMLHNPELANESTKTLLKGFDIEHIRALKSIAKKDFLKTWISNNARAQTT